MADILIVEDDRRINELIRRTINMTGHMGVPAFSSREALSVLEEKRIDLILLDIGLPDMDGFVLMRQIAREFADDYIVKPFAMEELLARVQVVLRRFHKEQSIFHIRDVEVDLAGADVKKGGEHTNLTKQEYELLKVLLLNKNIALSRERLLELAWGMDYYGDDRTVDVHIRRLRQKLGLENEIKTIFRYGYRLEI